ncbi:MAG: DNA translocase FtsK [Pseudomonadota bacterium]
MARRTLYQEDDRLFGFLDRLPPALRQFLLHRALELAGVVLLAASLGTLIALLTYSVADPSLSTAAAGPIQNALGRPGAILADIALQTLGIAAAVALIPLTVWAFWLTFNKDDPDRWAGQARRTLALFGALILAALGTACLPIPLIWPLVTGLGGIIGNSLNSITVLPLQSLLGGFAPILVGALALGGAIFLLGAASGIEWRDIRAALWEARRLAYYTRRAVNGFGARLAVARQRDTGLAQLLERLTPFLDADARADEALDWPHAKPAEKTSGRLEAAEDLMGGGPAGHTDPLSEPMDEPLEAGKKVPVKRSAKQQVAHRNQTELPLDLSDEDYRLPPLSLLARPRPVASGDRVTDDILEERARALEGVLDDFGIRGEIIGVRPGPVVTLYELQPAPGIKSSRVVGLADDIARSMSAVSARVAVIPGRNVIGIELPNERREMVFLRDLLSSEAYEATSMNLPLALGKTIGGDPIIGDIARMPHLLIAGTTGSGKSVSINTMILSLLYRLPPSRCKLIMIDPKMLELSVYDGIPHLLAPVVTDPRKAVVALKWVVREMEDRYRKMSKVGVRNIKGYNERISEAVDRGEELTRTVQTGFDKTTGEPIYEDEVIPLEAMPFIVVIVDEMADLMMVAGKDIENAVQRLAQMARAAGIHIITATQRPSVDVITGTIKANFPTRISFQVTSKIDSRTILGEQGAEQLLGQGDMLYMAGGGRISRVHAPFVSDAEVEKVVAHLKKQGRPDYLDDITTEPEEGVGDVLGLFENGAGESGDELYDKAVAVVARDRKASTSYVQRKLMIGYNRAARLIERMEEEGVISSPNHAGKREVLVSDHSGA